MKTADLILGGLQGNYFWNPLNSAELFSTFLAHCFGSLSHQFQPPEAADQQPENYVVQCHRPRRQC